MKPSCPPPYRKERNEKYTVYIEHVYSVQIQFGLSKQEREKNT